MFARLARNGIITLITLGALIAALPSLADEGAAETEPRYPRAVVRRGPARLPEPLNVLPEILRVSSPSDAASKQSTKGATQSRGAKPQHDAGQHVTAFDRVAAAAANRAAERRAAGAGRREYYRVGFHRGLRAATEALAGAGWEVAEGRRLAFDDPDARRVGRDHGAAAADELSRAAAADRVAEQFRDLSREPRFLPWPVPPSFTPAIPRLAEPTLEETFAAFPWSGFTSLGARYGNYLADWSYDPWSLRRCESPSAFHSREWSDAAVALADWRDERAASTVYRDLDAAGRQRFQAAFSSAFRKRLAQLFPTQLQTAFEAGLTDGWSYGSFVRQEWDFRRGYRQGYLEAHADAATREYDRSYALRYAFWYSEAYAGWAERPHPEVTSMNVRDADDDGVFEPGEQVLVEYELVNYGGSGGSVTVFLDGSVLEASARRAIDLPARGRIGGSEQLEGTIDVRAPLGETRLTLVVGEEATDLPLRVAHPLRFEPATLQARRDNLAGRLTLQVEVRNQSRRPVGGRVDLRRADVSPLQRSESLPAIEPGRSSTVSFDLSGLEPLELIGGLIRFDLTARGDGVEQDGMSYRVPDTVRDLASRDLPMLIRRQAHDRGVSAVDIATARRLLLERLREDWRVAATGRGNPYKKDFKRSGSRTALGDLVQLYRDEAPAAARPEVFLGLSGEIIELAEVLPGAHPLLRKYMRRLALELP